MILQQIQELYKSRPFRSFALHLADGERLTVTSREFLGEMPNGRTMIVYQPDGSTHIVDVLMITDIELRPLPQ